MVATGFAVATACVWARAPKFGIDRDNVVDLMIIMLFAGLAGARTFYVLQNLGYYRCYPGEILDLSKGGLVWYGAFLSGLAASAIYMKAKRMAVRSSLDLAAPYIALAQAIGRLGCFLNGCCYGIKAPGGFPFAVTVPSDGVARLPAQLFSAAALFAIFAILMAWQERRRFAGEVFLGYCLLYSAKRFLMEFMRGDNPRAYLGLTISQAISLAILVLSAAAFAVLYRAWKKRNCAST
jgi:phosphatidylglycerol:prolipoprotein diacylglycerol transferase